MLCQRVSSLDAIQSCQTMLPFVQVIGDARAALIAEISRNLTKTLMSTAFAGE